MTLMVMIKIRFFFNYLRLSYLSASPKGAYFWHPRSILPFTFNIFYPYSSEQNLDFYS